MHPQVKKLLEIPQYPQRSKEWFEQRRGKLTSSDVDAVLGNSKYASAQDILFKKCGVAKPFTGNEATRHGQKYEDEAIELYCKLYNKVSHSFGLLPHPTIPWLGGSPDDITEDGIVIEVKCPLRREIVMGKIPDHYIAQVRMNMEICDLDKAVFIEYKPPSETEPYVLNVVELDRDREWFAYVFPKLQHFWSQVMYYRTYGIETHPEYEFQAMKCREKVVLDVRHPVTCEIRDPDANPSGNPDNPSEGGPNPSNNEGTETQEHTDNRASEICGGT